MYEHEGRWEIRGQILYLRFDTPKKLEEHLLSYDDFTEARIIRLKEGRGRHEIVSVEPIPWPVKDSFGDTLMYSVQTSEHQFRSEPVFLPSMIEVPDDRALSMIPRMIMNGHRHFHVDVCSEAYIGRDISGFRRAQVIKQHGGRVHLHLMVKNVTKYIMAYHPYADVIYIDQLDNNWEYPAGDFPASIGAVVTLDTDLDDLMYELEHSCVREFLIMGVPLGSGGQPFDRRALQQIKDLRELADVNGWVTEDMIIEVDGGLTMENIIECRDAGATHFAGWSLVEGESTNKVLDNISTAQNLLMYSPRD